MNIFSKNLAVVQAMSIAVAVWWAAYRKRAKAISEAWNEYCSATDELEDYKGNDHNIIAGLEERRIAAQSLLWRLKS